MARRRRPGSRPSVVDGRAQLIVPIDAIADADGEPMRFGVVKRWFRLVDSLEADVLDADAGASVLLDRFAYDLHLSDVGHSTDVHDGETFFDAVRAHGAIPVYVVDGVDPRRSKPEDLDQAAAAGRVIGGVVAAFTVDVLDS